mmetsp:Transcript_4784/g.7764  ORF Transcript_4784/g.7764 Transcript_4784/m.7764 type:complete len:172 (+) Transcript_4784:767-1282(+)|eukprot:jgi/Bigna1/71446/fgenesh1_pg.15_\
MGGTQHGGVATLLLLLPYLTAQILRGPTTSQNVASAAIVSLPFSRWHGTSFSRMRRERHVRNWEDILLPEEEPSKRSHIGRKQRDSTDQKCKELAEKLCNLSDAKLKDIDISDSLRYEVGLARELKQRPKRKSWARQMLNIRSIIRESNPKAVRHLTDELVRIQVLKQQGE